jgi:hypothetical protein
MVPIAQARRRTVSVYNSSRNRATTKRQITPDEGVSEHDAVDIAATGLDLNIHSHQ